MDVSIPLIVPVKLKSMNNISAHKESYFEYVKIGIILLILTMLNILVASFAHSSIISTIVVLISALQAVITLVWLMHLNNESKMIRIFVSLTFFIYLIVIIITFFDYSFR
jgi:cytochrome c oxidase subunit IV